MKKYEGMFIVDTEAASKKWDEVDALIRDVVKKHEGETLDLAVWEERKLAYPIRKRRKGTYILGHFQVPPENLNNIRDEFKITETILRQIFVIDDGKRKFLENDEEEETKGHKGRFAKKAITAPQPAATDEETQKTLESQETQETQEAQEARKADNDASLEDKGGEDSPIVD